MPEANPPTPDPTTSTEPNPDDQEKAYWEKFEGKLDVWFDKKIEKYRTTGTTRTGGRTTLPEIFANMIFGKQEQK